MASRTIALDSKHLEGGIEALSSASRAFQLTPFERRAYRALMVSVDVAAWSLLASIATFFIFRPGQKDLTPVQLAFFIASMVAFIAFILAFVVGTISLVLNFPLVRKLYRERERLKELGLSFLSKSLWEESRRSRWISRARGALLIGVAILSFLFAVVYGVIGTIAKVDEEYFKIGMISFALFFATMAALIFSARYLHNQRERMELTANAEDLKKAFERLRQRAGNSEVVSVPSELLEQAARIESAQIAKERKDAVLQSVTVRPSGYAITFDRYAAEERATLGVADRVELEDLVAQLSTEGARFESQAGAVVGAEGATLRGMTKSQRVEIAYVIDQASHGIRITAVRPGGGGSHSSPSGRHSHA
jgi:hypothetical protein